MSYLEVGNEIKKKVETKHT